VQANLIAVYINTTVTHVHP